MFMLVYLTNITFRSASAIIGLIIIVDTHSFIVFQYMFMEVLIGS